MIVKYRFIKMIVPSRLFIIFILMAHDNRYFRDSFLRALSPVAFLDFFLFSFLILHLVFSFRQFIKISSLQRKNLNGIIIVILLCLIRIDILCTFGFYFSSRSFSLFLSHSAYTHYT